MQRLLLKIAIYFTNCLLCINFAFAETSAASVPNNEDVVLKGVTDFIADRAQANAEYMFEYQLKEEIIENPDAMHLYFPSIYELLTQQNILEMGILFHTDSKIWRDALRRDIIHAAILVIDKNINTNPLESKYDQELIESMLRQIIIAWNPNPAEIALMSTDIERVQAEFQRHQEQAYIDSIKDRVEKLEHESTQKCHPNCPNDIADAMDLIAENHKILNNEINFVAQIFDQLKKILDNKKSLLAKKQQLELLKGKFNEQISHLPSLGNANALRGALEKEAGDLHNDIIKLTKEIEKDNLKFEKSEEQSNPQLQLAIQTIFEYAYHPQKIGHKSAVISLFNNLRASLSQNKSALNKLDGIENAALFFASIADAKTSEQVTAVLKSFTLPPVSFGEKRNKNHLLISSFVGIEYSSFNPENTSRFGTYAPIGLELSQPIRYDGSTKGSIGVMLSPVDFGYPLSQKLNGSNYAVGWDDALNPSVAVDFGINGYPVNFGIAWQRINKSPNNSNIGNRWIGFISFDMPLFILH